MSAEEHVVIADLELEVSLDSFLDWLWPVGVPEHSDGCGAHDECLIACVRQVIGDDCWLPPVELLVANGVRDWLRRREASLS